MNSQQYDDACHGTGCLSKKKITCIGGAGIVLTYDGLYGFDKSHGVVVFILSLQHKKIYFLNKKKIIKFNFSLNKYVYTYTRSKEANDVNTLF
jgi:hypothetical protein